MSINAIEETKRLSLYLSGLAAGIAISGDSETSQKVKLAAEWMEKVSLKVCGQGVVGCIGGVGCASDHK